MKKLIKLITVFMFVSFFLMNNVLAVYTDSSVGTYEQELAKFPGTYQDKIRKLHEIYPNAVFVAQDKFFDWDQEKEIPVSWSKMLAAEKKSGWSLIETSSGWKQASESQIIKYLNPYNFLDETHIFMFESQFYYKGHQNIDGVKNLLKGTFMEEKNCGGSNKTYAEVIMEAAEKYNISPYMIASRLKQEQGVNGTSPLISGTYPGYEGYYNYFNIQASGKNDTETIVNGLKCAKGQLYRSSDGYNLCKGNNWNSPYASIMGGASFIRKSYIGVNDTFNVKGQMTNYLQKWDPYGPNLGGHQYMQNIEAPYYEAKSTLTSYKAKANYKSYGFVFYIPIYQGAPNIGESAVPNVSEDTTEIGKLIANKYKINTVFISGINIGTKHKDLINNIKSINAGINIELVKVSTNKSDVVATGDKLKITYNNKTQEYSIVIYGDINGDGLVDKLDSLSILRHYYKKISLSGVQLISANANKDNTIDKLDALAVLRHYYKKAQITQ